MSRRLNDFPNVSLKSENLDGRVDFAMIFGRISPVHIEIGSGTGTFLLNQASANVNDNFLGIEWASKYYRTAVDRIGRWGLTNVRIIRTEAASFIADLVPDESVDYFHIYFPDPWPKRSHHKRRFVNNVNLENLLRCIKHEGQIRIVTDHAEYFEQMQSVLTTCDKLEEIDFPPTAAPKRENG